MPTGSLAYDVMVAMEATARTALAAADTTYGAIVFDWGYSEPAAAAADSVLIISVTTQQNIATLGLPRSREEILQIDVHFYSFRSDQRQATKAAMTNAKLLETYCRGGNGFGDSTLGGVVRQCFLTGNKVSNVTPLTHMAWGRGCEVISTFTASQRITG